MLSSIDILIRLKRLLSKLGIKSARHTMLLWDPNANGGVGGEIEFEI